MTEVAQLGIVTAVHPRRSDYLQEAASSVELLRAAGTPVQWVICVDGERSSLNLSGLDAEVVSWGTSVGISAARNLALSRVRAEFAMPLDADDLLDPDGVASGVEQMLSERQPGWTGGNRLLFDGSATPHWKETASFWKAGELAAQWEAPFVFHPNSVIFRTQLGLSVGGWPALPANEDLGLVLAMSEYSEGYSAPHIFTHYRVWQGQEVQQEQYPDLKQHAFGVIAARINTLRQGRGRPPIQPPDNPGGAYGAHTR